MPIDQRYQVLRHVARAAGELALGFWRERDSLAVEIKGPQDFVTRADKEVENFIRRELASAFPDDGFLGEETSSDYEHGSERCGSSIRSTARTIFCAASPYWNVSIAYDGEAACACSVPCTIRARSSCFMRGAEHGAWRTEGGRAVRLQASRSRCGWRARAGSCGRSLRSLRRSRVISASRCADGCQRQCSAISARQRCRSRTLPKGGSMLGRARRLRVGVMAGLLLVEEAGGYVGPFPGPGGITTRGPVVATTAT